MKASATNYGPKEEIADSARRWASAVGRGLRALIRWWGTFALDAAETHLRSLDDRTLEDLGFDPRDLPIREQLARCKCAASHLNHTSAAMNYWR